MDLLNYLIEEANSSKPISLIKKIVEPHLVKYPTLKNRIITKKLKKNVIISFYKIIKKKKDEGNTLKEMLCFFKISFCELIQYLLVEEFKYNESDIIDINNELNKIIEKEFKWRDNQLKAIETSKQTDFINGIHSQSVGAGKSLIGLKVMWEYHKKYPKNNLMWLCERRDIPEKLFFKKYKNNKKYKLEIDYVKNSFWKAHDIIDLSKFNVIEMILDKPKNYYNLLNKATKNEKPYLIVVNRTFLTTKIINTSTYKYTKIKNIPRFCIIDECHSCMSSETYLLLNYMKYNWECKIQGLSATPYRHGKSKTKSLSNANIESSIINENNLDTSSNIEKLINIFHKSNNKYQLNILSWFNMKQAIEEGIILEPIFHWYEIKEISEKDARKKNYKYTTKEIKSILKVLNEIIIKCKYSKIIVWCKTIDNTQKWKDDFDKYKVNYENLQTINSYVDHSKIKNNDYDNFYEKENGILFCACKHREGSDIPFLSIEIFLDKVKNRGALPLIQHVGRVLRISDNKKNGHVIDSLMMTKDKEQEKIKNLLDKILKYYIELYDISLTDFSETTSTRYETDENYKSSKLDTYTEIINSLHIDPDNKKVTLKLKNNKEVKIDISNINLKEVSWTKLTSKFERLLKDTIVFSDYEEFVILKKYIHSLNIKSIEEYNERKPIIILKNDKAQESKFIENPNELFSHCWKGWIDFLGIDISNYPSSLNEWKTLCKSLNITNNRQYYEAQKTNINLPLYPDELYENENFKGITSELTKQTHKRR